MVCVAQISFQKCITILHVMPSQVKLSPIGGYLNCSIANLQSLSQSPDEYGEGKLWSQYLRTIVEGCAGETDWPLRLSYSLISGSIRKRELI